MKVSNDVAPATMASDSRSTEPMDGNEFAALLAAMAAIPAMAVPLDLLGAATPEASVDAATTGPPALRAMPTFAPTIDLTAFAAPNAAAPPTAAVTAVTAAPPTAAGAASTADTTFAVEVLSVSVGEVLHDPVEKAATLTTAPAPPMTAPPMTAQSITPPVTGDVAPATDRVATTSAAPIAAAPTVALTVAPAAAPTVEPAAAPAAGTSPEAGGAAAAPAASGTAPRSTPVATDAAPGQSNPAPASTVAVEAAPARTTPDTVTDSSDGPMPPMVAQLAATDVRESVAPKLTVPPTRIDTVAVAAARASAEAGRPIRLSLRLDPPNLGELRVELTARGGQVTVRLEPANGAAGPALHQQREAVAAALERSGFHLSGFDVANPEQQRQDDPRRRGTARAGFAVDETPTDEVEAVTGLRI